MLILYYILPKKRIKSGTFLSTLQQLPIDKIRRIRQIRDRQTQLQSIIGLKLLKIGICELRLRGFHLKKLHFTDLKPIIKNSGLPASTLHFSISHSQNCICCVISKTKPVGIDVEKNRPLSLNLIHRYRLTQKNVSPIVCWTQKEAVFKVLGEDRLYKLKNIHLKEGQALLNNRKYHINSFPLDRGYAMSVASLEANTKIKIKRVYF